jgi:hypothetical protein
MATSKFRRPVEASAPRLRELSDLPLGFARTSTLLRCSLCGRAWRCSDTGLITPANFDRLVEHWRGHDATLRPPVAPRWAR